MSDRAATVIVLAKEPVPCRVKTRLQPAFSASQAATLAAAALEDTVAAVRKCGATRRILAWEGDRASWQEDFEVIAQPSGTLNVRLAAAFAAAVSDPMEQPALLVGMDTPQVTAQHLDSDWEGADAVLGLSEDGGFWAIGLRYGHPSGLFAGVPMSTSRTGSAQLARLVNSGLSVKLLPPLRDVDRPEDADLVATQFPGLLFSRRYSEITSRRPPQTSERFFDAAYGGTLVASNIAPVEIDSECPLPLDVSRWSGAADVVDMLVVTRCEPPVIDLGCGPGRMLQALSESGRAALGVDMSSGAVGLSMARGGRALRRRSTIRCRRRSMGHGIADGRECRHGRRCCHSPRPLCAACQTWRLGHLRGRPGVRAARKPHRCAAGGGCGLRNPAVVARRDGCITASGKGA
jgi:glycosyltransferase A (GT-A) superfamily protein (DUF2064 family)